MTQAPAVGGRRVRALLGAAPALAAVVTLVALLLTGDLDARSAGDPGDALKVALPLAVLLRTLAVSAALGALAVAVWVIGPEDRPWTRLMDTAAAACGVWAVAAAGTCLLTFISATGLGPAEPRFGPELIGYLTGIELGRSWATEAVGAALLTSLCLAIRTHRGALLLLVLVAGDLVPLSLQAHARSTGEEAVAAPALLVHVLAAGTWTGGLAVMIVLAAGRQMRLQVLLSRYGTIGLICLVAVAISGTASAVLNLSSPAELASPFGGLVLVKVGSLLAAGLLGALIRARLLRQLATTASTRAVHVLGIELLVLVTAIGAAAALARTPSPQSSVPAAPLTTAAEILTGRPLPAPLDPVRLLTTWRPDLGWIVLGIVLAAAYGTGLLRVARSGGRWPLPRALAWYAGVGALVLVTSGAANVYEQVLLSAHVVTKVLLLLPIPALLVAGAPGRLIEQTATPRGDGSRGLLEWSRAISGAVVLERLSRPVPATLISLALVAALYTTPLLEWETQDLTGHEVVAGALVALGLLLCRGWQRALPGRGLALALMCGGLTGLALLMLLGGPIGADWFFRLGWPQPETDQRAGGAAVLALMPVIVLSAILQRPTVTHPNAAETPT